MGRELIAMQASQRGFEAQAEAHPRRDDQAVAELQLAAAVCRQLARTVKQIADGIAWRTLGYDRAALHELAFKPQSGHMELASAKQEIKAAARYLAQTGDMVILNDLTNFLRYGDFTSVGPGGIRIHEVKAGEGSARSGRASRQKKKTNQVVEFISRRERRADHGLEKLVKLEVKPISHLNALRHLISQARSHGSAHARLSDCLAVEVFDVEIMAEAFAGDRTLIEDAFHNPFVHSADAVTFDSLQLFDKFSWNIAPYSVFPLSNEDCIGLMTGSLLRFTYFNMGNLVRCLRRRGLQVRVPTREELKAGPRWMPGQVAEHELDNPIAVLGFSHALQLSFGRLGRMTDELLDEESFADATVELLKTAGDEQALIYDAFEDEASLWD